MELRQRNQQYQQLAQTMGMQNLTQSKFVKDDFINAFTEMMIDGAYAVTTYISKLLNMPSMAANYIQTRKAKETMEVKKNIMEAYKKQAQQDEWWDTYLTKRNELRTAEVQKVVGKEIKKIMIEETKKMQEKGRRDQEANQQLNSINTVLSMQTNQAFKTYDPRIPQTAMTSLAMAQGPLTTNMVDQINKGTKNLTTAMPPPLLPPPSIISARLDAVKVTVGGIQHGLKAAAGPPVLPSDSSSSAV